MFKNKEVKRLFFTHFLVFVTSLIISVIYINLISNFYKNELIKNNSYLIGSIIKNHPDLETEFISNIINHNSNYEDGYKILKKYGLDDIEALDYLDYNHEIKVRVKTYIIMFTIIVFIVLESIYVIFTRKQYKKIQNIDNYMNSILNNDYSMNIREYEEGDISNLKNDIYKMTVKLKEQTDASKKDKIYLEETLSDISHQIRTPLTSMYVINDILADDSIEHNVKKEFLLKNRNQLERIEWLVTSLLKMSRLDSGSVVLKKKKVKAKELIDRAVESLKIPIELKNINLNVDVDSEILLSVDLNWTIEALVNIIKNAYEHTDEGGSISIEVKNNPIYTMISITDTGEGISPEDMPHVFERFYKGKHNKESIGIGLNMAKKIIDMQGYEISVSSVLKKGTTFEIKFYKNII